MKIEIIGSIDDQEHYSTKQIADLLNQDQTELNYGSQFMGRPGTSLYSGANEIIKLRSELDLNAKHLRMWVAAALKLERQLKVHHPAKTWFIVTQDNDQVKTGNICPRLTPLHTLFADTASYSSEQKISLLKQVYYLYFQLAAAFNKRLDEGLSNFAVDSQQQLYYLDDDIYSWDNFVSFAHVLGVLVRSNLWMDENHAAIFAAELVKTVSNFFPDQETSIMIGGKLRDIFVPDEQRQRLLDIIIDKFHGAQLISKKKQFSDRYLAILADVHANLPALEAVLTFLQDQNINQGIVLGDTVGYGPHPEACIERLQESGFVPIKGNHDNAAISDNISRGMSSTARWCIEWTIPRLSTAHKTWLQQLPLELTGTMTTKKKWQALHGSPVDPNYFYGYVYEMTFENNLDVLVKNNVSLCFHGHSHIQGIYARKKAAGFGFFDSEHEQLLTSYSHCLVCPGSIGQPRNGTAGAQFAIYDQHLHSIKFFTINYPIEATISDLQRHNFPPTLITRLKEGY